MSSDKPNTSAIPNSSPAEWAMEIANRLHVYQEWDEEYRADFEGRSFELYDALARLIEQVRRDALEEAVAVANEEGRTNVENPAIDMYEMARRSGIRWCGDWTARKIRSLIETPPAKKEKE